MSSEARSRRVSPSEGDAALLDALPDSAVLLDDAGTIVAANHRWRRFAAENGGDEDGTGVGTDYLQVCARSQPLSRDAGAVALGIAAVLAGRELVFSHDYDCPSPEQERWFTVRVTPWPPGALVTHLETTRHVVTERALRRRADRDELTGLANRTRLHRRLTRAIAAAGATPPAVLYLDLDGFKAVNDRHGHATGDAVLQAVARRLAAISRAGDTVARIGGDEFAVVAPGLSDAALAALHERVVGTLAAPHAVGGTELVVPASVGVHVVTAGEDAADALHQADRAMYRAKHRTR